MKSYRLKIGPERDGEVWRVFDFSARHTLYDVHRAIQRAFALDDDHLHAFFMSGKHWDKGSEIEGPTPDRRGQTPRTRLYSLMLSAGQRFAYVFDFGAELWHSIEVVAISDVEQAPEEPVLVESVGEARAQYAEDEDEPFEVAPEIAMLMPLADALRALFPADDASDDEASDDEASDDDDASADEASDDDETSTDDDEAFDDDEYVLDDDDDDGPQLTALDLDPEALESARDLAETLVEALAGDAERLFDLEAAADVDLHMLLGDLPVALARARRVDAGAALAERLSFIDPPHFLGDRAFLLAEAGRREEALAQLGQNLESLKEDPWVEVKSAEAYILLDDPARAEALLRSAMQRARSEGDEDTFGSAVDRLLELLADQGRHEEARALLAEERARLDALVLTRSTPGLHLEKIGRNDPCPCGSGKKHKKCCLQ